MELQEKGELLFNLQSRPELTTLMSEVGIDVSLTQRTKHACVAIDSRYVKMSNYHKSSLSYSNLDCHLVVETPTLL